MPDSTPSRSALRAPLGVLLRPRLTSRSDLHRCPFKHEARSPQVRTHSFTARPPDLRHRNLVTRASRFIARSPCSAPPSIRFLFIGPQFRSTLPPHNRSPSCSCASLHSLRPACDGTCTRKSAPMLGAQRKGAIPLRNRPLHPPYCCFARRDLQLLAAPPLLRECPAPSSTRPPSSETLSAALHPCQ